MTIYIASDHAGYNLKKKITETYSEFVDLGTYTAQSGNQVTISLDVDNQFEVAGFQFWIEDSPNLLTTLSKYPAYNKLTLDTVRKFLQDSKDSNFKI